MSVEELAQAAEVSVESLRDLEHLGTTEERGARAAVCRALENAGVQFLSGSADSGPGVRLVANRPTLIQGSLTPSESEGVRFKVEWQGEAVTVFVALEVIEDLSGRTDLSADAVVVH